MAETLGALCDKLTIVKLKQYHTDDNDKQSSLKEQELQLQSEIDEYILSAISGKIAFKKLTFASNKIYNEQNNVVTDIQGTIGEVFSRLAETNCNLWHEQEKVYEFEKVPVSQKNNIVKQLALLNLKRTKCIDKIDQYFSNLLKFDNLNR